MPGEHNMDLIYAVPEIQVLMEMSRRVKIALAMISAVLMSTDAHTNPIKYEVIV